jgi:hypothetical protein
VAAFLGVVGCVFSNWGMIYSCGMCSSCGGCISLGKGADSSVEGRFLELGHFSFVGRVYVL